MTHFSGRAARAEHDPRGTLGALGGGKPEAVRVWLLDGFRVSVGSRTIGGDEWRLRKAASLIKVLALASPHHRLHREQVMNLLWPDLDSEKAANNNLRYALHFARRLLEPQSAPATTSHYLHLGGDLLALCPGGPLWVDVEAFEGAAATAQRTQEPAAYRAAIELYAGELLPEDRYEHWPEERREDLRTTYLALLAKMAELYEEREEYGPAIEALQKAVNDEPTHEEAHTTLMRLYARSGQRHRALQQYKHLQEALRQKLDSEPARTSRHLYEEIRAERFPVLAHSLSPCRGLSPEEPVAGAPRQHNLPSVLSSFVGREREMVEVKRLLSMTRLLTLTGTGGCGKTRLALEVASDLVGAYPDGVWLVELAALSEGALVPQAVAAALEVREQPNRPLSATLMDTLRSKQMLIVLDNCEHLIDACARFVDTIVTCCPHLRILATSREPLGVAGEANWPVPSLTVPDAKEPAVVGNLTQYEAVRLFVKRAHSRLPTFVLTPENTGAVVEVCQRLEGMPLAIELATARVTLLAVEQVAARLGDSLNLLSTGTRTADPRHQTLRATLEWSFELLSEPEQRLFGRLSVFAGGWTLEAAEEVGAGRGIEGGDVLDLLGRLVDKSLVVAAAPAGADAKPRYRMLEPIRQYGRERLEASGETEQVRERHARHYLRVAEQAEPELAGAHQASWLERLGREQGNLRVALTWALDRKAAQQHQGERTELGLRLAAALERFWGSYAPAEGRGWLERGLAQGSALPASVRAKALHEAGLIALFQNDGRGMAMLEESLDLFRELGDKPGAATALATLGWAVAHQDDKERIATLRQEAERLRSELVDQWVIAYLLLFLGFAALVEGDHERAEAVLEESLALARELDDALSIAKVLNTIAMAALVQGDCERAAALFREGLRVMQKQEDKIGLTYLLLGLAGVAGSQGQPARAARLWGATEALREITGVRLSPFVHRYYDYEGRLAAARALLDEKEWTAAWAEGRTMALEQAVEYALGARREQPSPAALALQQPSSGEQASKLTRREQEVAILVGGELTNRQIASELSISEHTVATHIGKTLKKLGLRSRSQIADRIIQQ